ncbi:MAG: N-acetylmuramic acid 6-phosphate etherase [Prevotellaceae bacterium]|jgi:N-acetylmuramic acid 6-phosphate etherase|nr:N-acetylmuramic acid 6-phosphate etherase [Prevotellaceae bacterium]
MQKVTEQQSYYDNLEQMSTHDLLVNINNEDKHVPLAVEKCIPEIEKLVDGIVERIHRGGRLFYIGAGTSGRLGILDASEIPPTYGAPFELIIGLIAGGDTAIRRAVESAEDKLDGAWQDMLQYNPTADDVLVGIAASGTTPYVIGGLRDARNHGMLTASITCNPDSPVAAEAEIKIEVIVGPEFVTGSTRMKSGTAQKLVLNMISTTTMVRLGKVKGNKMFDMQLSNKKLVDRGSRMIAEETGLSYEEAKNMLLKHGSVRSAVNAFIRENRKDKREEFSRKLKK